MQHRSAPLPLYKTPTKGPIYDFMIMGAPVISKYSGIAAINHLTTCIGRYNSKDSTRWYVTVPCIHIVLLFVCYGLQHRLSCSKHTHQEGCDGLLDIVSHHGEDLLQECIQLLLEQQGRVLRLHHTETTHTTTMNGSITCSTAIQNIAC